MSWVPPNLASACAVYTTITTCSSSTFLFLQLVTELFGRSKDDPFYLKGSTDPDFGFNTFEFSEFLKHNTFESVKREREVEDMEEFDFIVVGAGSAGCVVANRLSEVSEWKVLLIEAGDEEPDVADVPAFAPMLQRSSIDWGYMTQPQPNSCLARPQQRCSWARGKVMGGSSTINYLIYIRGHPKDYDEWEAMGNKGWAFKDVLPYFMKSEDNRNIEHVDPFYHGVGGYLTVERFRYQDPNIFALIEAYKELGLPEFDQNTDHQIGTMLLQHTTRDGERLSTNGAFIRPIRRKRSNLVVRPNSFVIRTLIDPLTLEAYGVEYTRRGKLYRALAKKEVILSSGSLNSPKILMLSGVGPAEHLESLGIQVIKDLRVGFNLHDHVTIDGVLFSLSNYTATTVDDNKRRDDTYYFRETQDGPLSSTGPLQVNAFVQTKYENDPERPDIQYSHDAANIENFLRDPILTAVTNVLPLAYYNGLNVRPILLNPKSRGVVMLNQTDPIYGDPLIFANTFTETIDLLRIVEGIKQSLNLLSTETLRSKGYRLVTVPLPACTQYAFGTDDYWACIATSYTTTIYHPVGTCKMGPKEDVNAVVDNKLRVYGIKNLRVIDASIMPKVIRGNTNAPTIMIAERGSDFIKSKWLQHINSDVYRQSKNFFKRK